MATPYDNAHQTLTDLAKASVDLTAYISQLEAEFTKEQLKSSTPFTSGGFSLPVPTSPPLAALATKLSTLRAYKEKHLEWGRKIHGVMMGYQREMQSAHKNLVKGRSVGFSMADVTVGTNEAFAKAIQHKHTVSPENSAVNEMIAKAANQLTGESGEAPLATQRKIIDVMINDPQNWWPFDLSDFSGLPSDSNLWDGIIPLAAFKLKAETQIMNQLNKYKRGKSGLDTATLYSIRLPKNTNLSTVGKSSVAYSSPGVRAEVLTIKMVFGQPRPFKRVTNGDVTVKKAVFVAYANMKNTTISVDMLSPT